MSSLNPRSQRQERADEPALTGDSEYERLFNLSLEMLCIAGTDGYFRRLNPAFQKTLGYEADDLLSRPFIEFVHPEDRQRTLDVLQKISQGIPTVHFENRYRCRDGSYRWLAWTAMPQEPTGAIYATARDVTDAKLAEEALRESAERYQQLLAAVTSYTYCVTLENGVPLSTEHSPGCLAATGYSPEEYAADPYLWMNMVHPEDQEIVRRLISATLRRERPSGAEHRIRRKDGKIRWVRSTIVPYYDDAGALVRYDGLVEDITERKRAEQRFGRLLESAPDAMVAVDQDGRIVLTNLQAEQAFGYGREELLGQQVEILLPERFRAWHPQHRAEYVANPSIRPIGTMRELSALRKDGSEFPVEIMLSFLETEEGMLISSAIRDITERKRMERSLQEREAQLLAARRIQERLLPQRPPQVRPFEIAGTSRPADFVGGDYFDYFPLPDGSVGIVIADVTGHGLPAALLASSIRTLLRSLANHHREITEIFALANSVLLDETEEDLFVTALLGRLDCQTRSFAYASAGHPTAYLLDAAGEVKACLESTGPPLAVLGQVDFPIGGRFTLQPGDVLLLVTDGVVEARSTDGEPFGTQRMLEVVRRRRHSAAGEIVAALSEEVCTFVQPGQLADDVTAVVIKAGSD